jgi:penicillin-binding protein 1A
VTQSTDSNLPQDPSPKGEIVPYQGDPAPIVLSSVNSAKDKREAKRNARKAEKAAAETSDKLSDKAAKDPSAIAALLAWLWQTKGRRRLTLLVGLAALGVGGFTIARYIIIQQLPDPQEALTFARPGTMTIKSVDGEILQKVGDATQIETRYEQIPKRVIDAFVASEDRRFYNHDGVDYQSIARAIQANLTAGEVREGGSTLTQQLARVAFLDNDQNLGRKLREAFLAQKIEGSLTKKQILERYLNLVYLGSNAYGVADAAWIYFGKSLNELTLSETALIAGLPPAPSRYSPLVNPEFAKQRRSTVLRRMVEAGYITESEAEVARQEPIKTSPKVPKYIDSKTPYFTTYIRKELESLLPKAAIAEGGLQVETTLNYGWQDWADKTTLDIVNNEGYNEGFDQASITVIDPKTGEIRVMVGGKDTQTQFNRVTQAQRQPGSTFKTFVYTAAIAAGFSPYDSYSDAPFIVDGYQPKNYGNRYFGSASMTSALTSSMNVVAVKTLIDVGYKPVIKIANEMGIRSKVPEFYSMALGSAEVNLLELTSAYGTLANQGTHIDAHGIVRVLDRKGKVIFDASKKYKPLAAVDKDSAAIMTWMLEHVVNEGTGRPAILAKQPVAGKTGTSEKARDLWFIGYTPQLVAGVWLGNDDNYPTGGSSGTAALLWYEVMKKVTEGFPEGKFPELPKLEGRKGSIKADRIKVNYTAAGRVEPDPNAPRSSGGDYSDQGGGYSGGGGYSDQGGGGYSDQGGGGGYSDPAPSYDQGGGGGYSDPAPSYDQGGGGGYSDPAPEAPVYNDPPPAPPPEPVYEEPPPPPPEEAPYEPPQ